MGILTREKPATEQAWEPMDLAIADLQISTISDEELESAFHRVLAEHKDAVASIHQSMKDADAAYRKYLDPGFEPIEEEAKKDRAALNKAEKNIAEKFADLKAAYERPLEQIETSIKKVRSTIKEASGQVDAKVKAYEEEQKGKKQAEIQAYFDSRDFDLVPLNMIFNERWLNKGYKMPDIKKDIDTAIANIYGNIKVLENIAEHGTAAKAFYLDTLDMGAAMQQVERLKANAVKLAQEKIDREDRERQAQIDRNAAEERMEERHAEKVERVQSLADAALEIEEPVMPESPPQERIFTQTLQFEGTERQLRELRRYMTAEGILYKKGAIFENDDDAVLYMREKRIDGKIYYFVLAA